MQIKQGDSIKMLFVKSVEEDVSFRKIKQI